MPYYVVRIKEVTTHELVVLAKSKQQVLRMNTDVFADICSENKAFFSLDERTIESVETAETWPPGALLDDVHMDVRNAS